RDSGRGRPAAGAGAGDGDPAGRRDGCFHPGRRARPAMTGPTVMLVAAEASGDDRGAALARAIRARAPQARFVGVGGARMRAEGVESPFDFSELSVLGLWEGLQAYPKVVRRADE